MNRRARIIELNDQLRTTFKGGRVQMTPAVYNLDPQLRGRALCAMARSNKFDHASDHDWGVMIFAGYAFEWRIEYRAVDGTGVSPDPADPDKTFRVLTLYTTGDLLAFPANHSTQQQIPVSTPVAVPITGRPKSRADGTAHSSLLSVPIATLLGAARKTR
jgi:hypothetical protein